MLTKGTFRCACIHSDYFLPSTLLYFFGTNQIGGLRTACPDIRIHRIHLRRAGRLVPRIGIDLLDCLCLFKRD